MSRAVNESVNESEVGAVASSIDKRDVVRRRLEVGFSVGIMHPVLWWRTGEDRLG
jgi:hypothetical protein